MLALIKCIKEIKEWMIENHTYPELIERGSTISASARKKQLRGTWQNIKNNETRGRRAKQNRLETFHRRQESMTNQEPTGTLPALLPNTHGHQHLDDMVNWETA